MPFIFLGGKKLHKTFLNFHSFWYYSLKFKKLLIKDIELSIYFNYLIPLGFSIIFLSKYPLYKKKIKLQRCCKKYCKYVFFFFFIYIKVKINPWIFTIIIIFLFFYIIKTMVLWEFWQDLMKNTNGMRWLKEIQSSISLSKSFWISRVLSKRVKVKRFFLKFLLCFNRKFFPTQN